MTAYAGIATIGSAGFLGLLGALHVLKPDVDPSWAVISAYALGDYGWLMTLAFAAMAAACAALCLQLRPSARSVPGRIGLVVLAVSAVGFTMAAIFPTDPITVPVGRETGRGQLHAAGAMLGGVIPIAALALSWDLSRRAGWERARFWLWAATAAAWVGDLVFIGAMAVMLPRGDGALGPNVLIGWPNRLMIATYCIWVATAAWQSGRVESAGSD